MKQVESKNSGLLRVIDACTEILSDFERIRKDIRAMGGGESTHRKLERLNGPDPRDWVDDGKNEFGGRCIYAIECLDIIKIGIAFNGKDRVTSLQTGNPIKGNYIFDSLAVHFFAFAAFRAFRLRFFCASVLAFGR